MVFSLRLFPDKKFVFPQPQEIYIMKKILMILSILVVANFAAAKDVPKNVVPTAAPETEEQAIDATEEAIAKLQALQEQTRKIAAERARVKSDLAASRARLADLQQQLSELQEGLEDEQAAKDAKEDQLERTTLSAETKQKIDALVEQVREISVPANPTSSSNVAPTASKPAPRSTTVAKPASQPAPPKEAYDELPDRPTLKKNKDAHEEESEEVYEPAEAGVSDSVSHLSLGIRFNVAPSSDVTLNTMPGFAVSSSTDTQPELWVSWREDNVVLELAMTPGDSAEHDLQFFGTSLGKATVTGPQVGLSASYVVYEKSWVKAWLGIGFQQFEIESSMGMGGVPFTVTGDGWHAVGKLGAEFPVLQSNFSITSEIIASDTEIKITIPGGGTAGNGEAIISNGSAFAIGGAYHF